MEAIGRDLGKKKFVIQLSQIIYKKIYNLMNSSYYIKHIEKTKFVFTI